ncbi:MAG TPA: efflux RND transporter periplasmic adaptor subunit [Candidatus Desulfaltia sp.]|nr:efflux RND transporter periplasmic adaptor subunit [Candidatus Desulfaltia sp.]
MRMTSGPARSSVLAKAVGAALFLVIIAAIVSLPVLLPSCRKNASPSVQTVKREKILISTIKRGFFKETISLNGKILPVNIVYLDALEGGRVDKIFVEVGSMVDQGDPILQMTNTNLLMDIMFRESELFQQSNNLRNTRLSMEQYKLQLNQQFTDIENKLQQQRRVYERYKELEKDSLISRHEYELAKDQYEYLVKQKDLTVESQKSELKFRQAQIEALEESLNRMQANLDIVKQRQENLTLVAPVLGQLTSLLASIGESVSPGARLGQIDQWDLFKVMTDIDERYIAQVKIKDVGEFEFAGQTYKVDVRKIYPEVKDGKFEVDLEFVGEHPSGLKRGQSLQIRLNLVDSIESLFLARGDFSRSSGNRWVYVLDETGKAAVKRRIRTGRQTPQLFEVLEGVTEGETVIVSSYESFKNCDRLILR